MTEMSTTTPTTIRRLTLLRPGFPKLGIGATLAAICGVMGDALKMAYVDPYTGLHRQPQVAPDDDLEGRDPDW